MFMKAWGFKKLLRLITISMVVEIQQGKEHTAVVEVIVLFYRLIK